MTGVKTDILDDDNAREYYINIEYCYIFTKAIDKIFLTEWGTLTQMSVCLETIEEYNS